MSLRAPRIVVLIPREGWELHARRGVEALTKIWGGAGGVVVPTDSKGVHSGVARLLKKFDPDYAVPLAVSLSDLEFLRPGLVRLERHGRQLRSPAKRADFIAEIERSNSTLSPSLSDEAIKAASDELACFYKKAGEFRRIHHIHPSEEASRPLSPVSIRAEDQIAVETGDELLDLALAVHRGIPDAPAEKLSVTAGTLSHSDASAVLAKNGPGRVRGAPFESTREGLTSIRNGFLRDESPVVVLGRAADDMALAMLWDRLVGTGIWLPVTGSQTKWHPSIGVNLDHGRRRGHDPIRVTSVSLNESRCRDLVERIWNARWLKDPTETGPQWDYVGPDDLDPTGRVDLRMHDRWEDRVNVPVELHGDGSAQTQATLPLVTPDPLPESRREWIVDVVRPNHPVLFGPALVENELYAENSDIDETHVRSSFDGLSFECGRWSWVSAGASRFGQFAQPKLRWPGLLNSLKLVAARSGHAVQASYAGKIGRITAELWGGRDLLAEDLAGTRRALMTTFVSGTKRNGPLDSGHEVDEENSRLMLSGNCLVPFHALTRIAEDALSEDAVRTWLDARVASGAIRMGFALGCGVCPWADFYRIDEVATHFSCKRCGARNTLTQPRWRKPTAAPRMYYSLHPTIAEFLRNNGDVPLLAVRRYADFNRAYEINFEIELLAAGETRPRMEVDFAFLSRDGLVLGEAKSVSKLDGADAAERMRDVNKLLDAANMLGAREVCFATTKTWSTDTLTTIARAVERATTRVTLSTIERLGTPEATNRKILHNPAGP